MKSDISTRTDFTLLKKLLTLFLRCISLFEDVNAEYINRSVQEVHSILEKRMSSTRKSPFGAFSTNWTRNSDVESEIKVLSNNDIIIIDTITSTYEGMD